MIKFLKLILIFSAAIFILLFFTVQSKPGHISYGVSFSKFHVDELKLDWQPVYLAILDDLGVRNLRLSAHWPNTEPQEGKFNFTELDFQMIEAQKRNASVILAIGRRLPGWPECHEPEWIKDKDVSYRNAQLLEYIEVVVNRYKKFENIKYWQIENEPFLGFFGRSHCGALNENFLKEEIALVQKLDPTRQILVTDSGEFGTWHQAYRHGDVFGTSMYLYIWQRTIGPMRYPITPAFFVLKQKVVSLLFGPKKSILIELSAEPWLLQPIINTPLSVLLDRMGIDKFNEMINFASKTGFDEQYLWGAEWWYWMKEKQNHPEFWDRAKPLFNGDVKTLEIKTNENHYTLEKKVVSSIVTIQSFFKGQLLQSGNGLILTEDGLIITLNSLVPAMANFLQIAIDGKLEQARVLARDQERNLAILSASDSNLDPANFTKPGPLASESDLFTVGSTFYLGNSKLAITKGLAYNKNLAGSVVTDKDGNIWGLIDGVNKGSKIISSDTIKHFFYSYLANLK